MKIKLTSVPISDYDKALKFYTEVLGFVKKHDIPLGGDARWLTVVSPEEPNGTELLLEPNADYPAMKALKESLVKDGIPITAFQVDHIQKEYERLKKARRGIYNGTYEHGNNHRRYPRRYLRQPHSDISVDSWLMAHGRLFPTTNAARVKRGVVFFALDNPSLTHYNHPHATLSPPSRAIRKQRPLGSQSQ